MDFQRLFDILPYQEKRYAQKAAVLEKDKLKWKAYSTQKCLEKIQRISAKLIDLGLERGDKAALLVHCGSPNWLFMDLALQQIGVIVVPVHATSKKNELLYILKDAAVKIAIVSNEDLFQKILSVKENVLSLQKLLRLDVEVEYSITPTDHHLAEIIARKTSIHEDDLATIIYTSGTTGDPKGVMLSHKNIVANIKATISLVPVNCDKKTLSFLPVSHIFERMVIYAYLSVGASIYFVENNSHFLGEIKSVKPHYFTVVPRVLERVYNGMLEQMEEKNKLQQMILKWAVNIGECYKDRRNISFIYWCKLKIADVLVFRKWRTLFGGKVEGVIVGAAALQAKLGRLFSAAGIEVREGYGLTETSPVIAFNRFEPGGVQFGTVGIPIPGIDLRINEPDEDGAGEIQVKGPSVMLGYYNKPALTLAVLKDGWFSTGDVGKIVHKRFLKITDRKKDIFKTTTGKYISPLYLESILNQSPLIMQTMIIGFNRPFVTALILPDFIKLEKWCKANDVHWTAPQFMVINPKVVERMTLELDTINETLSNIEKIRNFHLLFEEWTIESGAYTPTLKLKRDFIMDQHRKEIENLYEE